jgi:hypothetical protein
MAILVDKNKFCLKKLVGDRKARRDADAIFSYSMKIRGSCALTTKNIAL